MNASAAAPNLVEEQKPSSNPIPDLQGQARGVRRYVLLVMGDQTVTTEIAGTRGDRWTIEPNGLVIALTILRVYKHQARLAITTPDEATVTATDPYADLW